MSSQLPFPCPDDNPPAKPSPCLLVVFGAHGDLTKRKLVPSLFNLQRHGLLPERFAILGNSRTELTTEQFREVLLNDYVQYLDPEIQSRIAPGGPLHQEWRAFAERWHYLSGDIGRPETYRRLSDAVTQLDRAELTQGNFLFYLATAPDFFLTIVHGLSEVGLAREEENGYRRFIMEKPFGSDLESARKLNHDLGRKLKEHQIFRIDHYLGKETVQNIMVFRFANGIFEPIWNRNFIESVQITVGETLGVENRGSYYESAGALRDMVPNHLFQLLSLIAMEAPTAFQGDSVRDEKTKAIKAIRPLTPDEIARNVIRGQYGPGQIKGESVPGYRSETRVAPGSQTETFVAMKLWLDNWRWAGVPFYLRTGKRLAQRISEVRIRFRRAPYQIFRGTSCKAMEANQLLLQLQPEEKITLHFGAKIPGPRVLVKEVGMEFDYANTFGKILNTGYETLLYDAMNGDPTLFMRADQIEASWAVVTPILEAWRETPAADFPNYRAGSWGPSAAGSLEDKPLAADQQKDKAYETAR